MTKTNESLNQLLADYQVLYQKLRAYHWNVTGPMFFSLHTKFEELYNDAAMKVDEVAERIRTLGGYPHSTLSAQVAAARLKEDGGRPGAVEMVQSLVADYGSLNGWLRQAATSASHAGDVTTANLLEGFADGQEKTLWMLRSVLEPAE